MRRRHPSQYFYVAFRCYTVPHLSGSPTQPTGFIQSKPRGDTVPPFPHENRPPISCRETGVQGATEDDRTKSTNHGVAARMDCVFKNGTFPRKHLLLAMLRDKVVAVRWWFGWTQP